MAKFVQVAAVITTTDTVVYVALDDNGMVWKLADEAVGWVCLDPHPMEGI